MLRHELAECSGRDREMAHLHAVAAWTMLAGLLMMPSCRDRDQGPAAPGATTGQVAGAEPENCSLLPFENGYLSVYRDNWDGAPAARRVLTRFVFDLRLLAAAKAYHDKHGENADRLRTLRDLGWDGRSVPEDIARWRLIWGAYVFGEVARQERELEGSPRWIECFEQPGLMLWICEATAKAGRIERRPVPAEARANISQRLFCSFGPDGEPQGYGEGGRFAPAVDWEPLSKWPQQVPAEIQLPRGRACASAVWAGRSIEVCAGSASNSLFLFSPGLGIVALGDFRSGAVQPREKVTAVLGLLVRPAVRLFVYNPNLNFHFLD